MRWLWSGLAVLVLVLAGCAGEDNDAAGPDRPVQRGSDSPGQSSDGQSSDGQSSGDAGLTDVVLGDGWLNADGTELVVDSRYGVPRWSTVTGELLTADADPGLVGIGSPDGSMLADFTDNGKIAQVVIRDADDGSEVTRLNGPGVDQVTDTSDRPLTDLAFSPDNERVAATSRDGEIWLWVIGSGVESRFEVPGLLNGLAWEPEGDRLVVTIADRPTEVISMQPSGLSADGTGQLAGPAQRDIAWSPDGQWIAGVGTRDGTDRTVTVWDADTLRVAYQDDARSEINDIAFSHDSAMLAITRDEEPEVFTWEFRTSALYTMPNPPEVAREVLWAPDDSRIYAIGDHQVASWDVESRGDPMVFEEHPAVAEVLANSE